MSGNRHDPSSELERLHAVLLAAEHARAQARRAILQARQLRTQTKQLHEELEQLHSTASSSRRAARPMRTP